MASPDDRLAALRSNATPCASAGFAIAVARASGVSGPIPGSRTAAPRRTGARHLAAEVVQTRRQQHHRQPTLGRAGKAVIRRPAVFLDGLQLVHEQHHARPRFLGGGPATSSRA